MLDLLRFPQSVSPNLLLGGGSPLVVGGIGSTIRTTVKQVLNDYDERYDEDGMMCEPIIFKKRTFLEGWD